MTEPSLAVRLVVHPEVAAALASNRPVVALESTLISHGLPYPQNVEVARASEDAVRAGGSVPATIAIRDGRILVGLEPEALEALATAPVDGVLKAARPSLAIALAARGWAGTTVSATMLAAHAAGIEVFATGGIGGVHRAAGAGDGHGAIGGHGEIGAHGASFDVSSDLDELARTPMVVVCAGPKAILDVAATLEVLETRGVPVVAVGQSELPGFFARSSGLRAPASVPDEAAAARLAALHLGLGLGSSLLVCVPVPEANALPRDVAVDAVERAVTDAEAAGIAGPALTPWLLARIATITEGASVRANTALIVNNAGVAGRLAVGLAAAIAAGPAAKPQGG